MSQKQLRLSNPKALKISAIPDHETRTLTITELELNLTEDEINNLYHKIFLVRMGPPGKDTGRYVLKFDFV